MNPGCKPRHPQPWCVRVDGLASLCGGLCDSASWEQGGPCWAQAQAWTLWSGLRSQEAGSAESPGALSGPACISIRLGDDAHLLWLLGGLSPLSLKRPRALSTLAAWPLETPWTVARQTPLSMQFSRQEYWSMLPFPSAGDLPNPGIEPGSPALPADARVARGSASWLSSHGRGLGPPDVKPAVQERIYGRKQRTQA